jgi:hypothetical protein
LSIIVRGNRLKNTTVVLQSGATRDRAGGLEISRNRITVPADR